MTRRAAPPLVEAPRTRSSRRQGRPDKSASGGRFLLFWLACLLLFLVWRQDLVLPVDLPFELSAIASRSMEPAYPMGSLAVIVPADKIEVGDVIAFRVPLSARETYGLPPRLLHRVVEYNVAGGRLKTKGDALGEPDPFTVDVVWVLGKPRYQVPYLGFALLFLWSDFGKPWLVFVAFAAVYPALAGRFRRLAEPVNRLLALGGTVSGPTVAGPGVERPPVSLPAGSPIDTARLDAVHQEVRATRRSFELWEAAMSEYGTHLKSHTAVLQHLDQATDRLAGATAALSAEVQRLRTIGPETRLPAAAEPEAPEPRGPRIKRLEAEVRAAGRQQREAGARSEELSAPWQQTRLEWAVADEGKTAAEVIREALAALDRPVTDAIRKTRAAEETTSEL